VDDIQISSNEFNIYPNPATDEFTIQSSKFKVGDVINVLDVMGRMVYQTKISTANTSIKIQTSSWMNGIYLVQIKTTVGVLTQKLVVQH